MKKIFAISLTALMAVSLAACGSSSGSSASSGSAASSESSAPASASSSAEAASSSSEAPLVVGGWEISENTYSAPIAEDASAALAAALKDSGEEKPEGLVVLGTQVVAGLNYMYFCKGADGYEIVTVYHDLEGNDSVSNTVPFNLENYINCDAESSKGTEPGLSGGWQVNSECAPAKLDSDVQAVFDNALEGFTGASYTPAALLATQLVSGTNYAFLCSQELVTAEPVYNFAVVTIYQPLDGDPSIQSICPIDLAEFNK